MRHDSLSSGERKDGFLRDVDYKHFISNFNLEQDIRLHQQLQDVEYSEPASMKVLYQFKMKTRNQFEDQATEAKQEYISSMMKPNRLAAVIEKLKVIKKNVGRKLRVNEYMS